MHRNIHGHKDDHALLACTWKWRLRKEKSIPTKDFSCLDDLGMDKDGIPIKNKFLDDFNTAVNSKLESLAYGDNDSATAMYNKICADIYTPCSKLNFADSHPQEGRQA